MRIRQTGLLVTILMFALIILGGMYPNKAIGGTYLNTAHGNSTSGVDRSAVTGSPYPDASPYAVGHCGHCHEMHASIGGAEPLPTGDIQNYYSLFKENFGSDTNELCYACHETFTLSGMPIGYGRYGIYQGKTKYNNSIHFNSGNMVWSSDPVPPGPPYDDVGNCHNCHNPHGYSDGSLIPHMLFARDSQTGDSPDYEMGCEACHDGSQGGISKDIKAQLSKTYSHPAHAYNNRHTLPETGTSEGGSSFGNPPTYDKRHSECVDCHNPHALGPTNATHTPPGNTVSDVLKNVWGVEPAWPGIWTQPTTFTVRKPPAYVDGSQYEYQICFKCHSYYGLGTLTNAVSTIIGPSGTNITDQAWEYNRNNKSAHPVVVSSNSQTGSYAPKALTAGQMIAPWTGVGNQTMYCSDCHGADDESFGAKGPHGSTAKYMLKGTGKLWPLGNQGVPFSLNDISGINKGESPYNVLNTNWSSTLFCLNCHNSFPSSDKNTWSNTAHEKHDDRDYRPTPDGKKHNTYCITGHSVVPHGNKRSRLMVYRNEPEPYIYQSGGSTYSALSGFKKASGPFTYDKTDCKSPVNGCSGKHDWGTGFDP